MGSMIPGAGRAPSSDPSPHRARSSFGWAGGYLVGAWVALQVTETLASLIGLPLWFGKAVLGLLITGGVVVAATALVQARRSAPGAEAAGRRRLLSRLTWRRAVLLGVLGFAVLGMVAAGHMTARALGVGPVGTLVSRGLLPDDTELVLADFEDRTGEEGVARAAVQALRVHLSQSEAVRLASSARVAEVLARMEAPAEGGLAVERAREVAIREGLPAVIAGEIHRLGQRYTISARVVAAESGAELVSVLETASEPDGLISAVERLSLRLRERIGESLVSVRRSPPLGRVRTASLAALKSWTAGTDANSRGDFEACVLLMEEAIALDSTFAMALAGRAACNQNLGRNRAQQVADYTRAYRMRERMTEEERLRFAAMYHHYVAEDRKLALDAWQAFDARFPNRSSVQFALGNLLAEDRKWDEAERLLRRGLEIDPSSVVVLLNLAGYQANRGQWAQAHASIDSVVAAVPQLDVAWRRGVLHLSAGEWDAAQARFTEARERARGNHSLRGLAADLESRLARTRGRMAEAEALLREALAARLAAGEIENYHLTAAGLAELRLEVWGDSAGAVAILEQAVAARPLEALDPFERSHLAFAGVLARAGRPEQARRHVDEWVRSVAALVPGTTLPRGVDATFAEAEGRWADAIAAWRLADVEVEDPLPALAHIGYAFDRLGRADSAIAYYRRYLETPSRTRYESDPSWRGRIVQRLAALHEARGEPAEAARYWAELVELWAAADSAVLPQVSAARARLAALTRDRG